MAVRDASTLQGVAGLIVFGLVDRGVLLVGSGLQAGCLGCLFVGAFGVVEVMSGCVLIQERQLLHPLSANNTTQADCRVAEWCSA